MTELTTYLRACPLADVPENGALGVELNGEPVAILRDGDDVYAMRDVCSHEEVPLSEVKDDLSRYLREAESHEILITRHGKPAGVLIGFASEDDWLDYRLENDRRFLERIAAARDSLRHGKGVALEDVDFESP